MSLCCYLLSTCIRKNTVSKNMSVHLEMRFNCELRAYLFTHITAVEHIRVYFLIDTAVVGQAIFNVILIIEID